MNRNAWRPGVVLCAEVLEKEQQDIIKYSNTLIKLINPDYYGILDLKIDEKFLRSNKIVILNVEGIFSSGNYFIYNSEVHRNSPRLELDFSEVNLLNKTCNVYLTRQRKSRIFYSEILTQEGLRSFPMQNNDVFLSLEEDTDSILLCSVKAVGSGIKLVHKGYNYIKIPDIIQIKNEKILIALLGYLKSLLQESFQKLKILSCVKIAQKIINMVYVRELYGSLVEITTVLYDIEKEYPIFDAYDHAQGIKQILNIQQSIIYLINKQINYESSEFVYNNQLNRWESDGNVNFVRSIEIQIYVSSINDDLRKWLQTTAICSISKITNTTKEVSMGLARRIIKEENKVVTLQVNINEEYYKLNEMLIINDNNDCVHEIKFFIKKSDVVIEE